MENISIEEYIKDLSPELQEKARACRTTDELIKLAEENKVPIPDKALEAIAGGGYKECPKGGEHEWKELYRSAVKIVRQCIKCGFTESIPAPAV